MLVGTGGTGSASGTTSSHHTSRPFDHRGVGPAGVVDDEDTVHTTGAVDRLVGDLLHLDQSAPALEAVGADHDLGPRVAEPGSHCLGSVSGEDRDEDRSDPGHGEERHHCLYAHGQKHGNRIPLGDAEPVQCSAETANHIPHLAKGQLADLTRLFLAAQRDPARVVVGPPVDTCLGQVEATADEPGRPLMPSGCVPDRPPRPFEGEAEEIDDRLPEPLRVGCRPLTQLIHGRDLDARA